MKLNKEEYDELIYMINNLAVFPFTDKKELEYHAAKVCNVMNWLGNKSKKKWI